MSNRPKLRILVAEDRPELAAFLVEALNRSGFDVEGVPDGQAAWELLSSAPSAFDVLITDNQMPRLTGLELVQKLRTIDFRGKVLVHSGHLQAGIERAFVALRVNRVLRKSVKLEEIVEAILE